MDIVVEGDALKLAKAIAKKLKAEVREHKTFGTATILCEPVKVDIATAREESYQVMVLWPVVKPSTIDKDLKRRDFTINAIAVSFK